MEFDEKLVKYMRICMANVKYRVFVNGDGIHLQELGIGLQQGDPLLPYLFIIVMKVSQSCSIN